jgi:release factor glutamine methyltransferase
MPPDVKRSDTVRALVQQTQSQLAAGPHPERCRRDAELLLRYALQCDAAWLFAHADDCISDHCVQRFEQLLRRRLDGEPMQYILGEAEFFGLTLSVDPAVLIPRPETELLVESVLDFLRGREHAHIHSSILDLGTGSGAIAIALAVKHPQAQFVAADLSSAALSLAAENASRHGVDNRIDFRLSDLFSALEGERFDCIVSNPPYVPLTDKESLDVEVREYEPELALFAGDDGLAIYRRLIQAAPDSLVPEGMLALEIGFGQRESIAALLAAAGFQKMKFFSDYQQIPRVAIAWEAVL